VYGLMMMPVAISFSIYALNIYLRRMVMIRRRDPGPYEDRVGPVVLAGMLMVTIIVNFLVKLYDLNT
jgi:uncharacterized membrane protein YidH (DUF202 family)